MNGLHERPVVLIADDEPALLELFQLVLTPAYEVVTATDGETAWARIQRRRPAVVLLDVHLPRRSGVALAAAIRAAPELASARVLLLTGLSEAAAQDAVNASGAHGYLLKPVRVQDLLAAVEAAFQPGGSSRPRTLPLGERGGRTG
jgi:DNA-binding response OmpR family regulator